MGAACNELKAYPFCFYEGATTTFGSNQNAANFVRVVILCGPPRVSTVAIADCAALDTFDGLTNEPSAPAMEINVRLSLVCRSPLIDLQAAALSRKGLTDRR